MVENKKSEDNLKNFVEKDFKPDPREIIKGLNLTKTLQITRIIDIVIKIFIPIGFILFFSCLLWVQNKTVFELVKTAQSQDNLEKLQGILGILVSATLTETYFIIRKIVDWLCQDIDYKSNETLK